LRHDARDLVDGDVIGADLCIVGGGAAGITLALALASSGLTVILLESGGLAPDEATSALAEARMTGIQTWSPAEMRVRALGGATGHWEGFCRPLAEADFGARSWLPGSGWPITRAELEPYYALAQQTLELGAFDYDPATRAARSGRPLLPFGAYAENRHYQLSPPTRMGERYLAELDAAAYLDVYTHANVTNIVLDAAQQRVFAVDFKTLSGHENRVQAGLFVLAMGGLENARLLLASNTQRASGVANEHDVVGRYFMEHPRYEAVLTGVHGALPDLSFYAPHASDLRAGSREVNILGAIGLSAAARAEHELLDVTATLAAVPLDRSTGSLPLDVVQALVTRDGTLPGALAFTLCCEQAPLADSRVTLDGELDALGMPRLCLDWRISPEDDARMARAARLLARELGALGLGRLWFPSTNGRLVATPKPGGHHLGTTRMGTDPATSVVDANCRCHGLENLFIAGSSVFPTGGDAHPTLTIVALAHRLAAHLEATT
jgi:choline dehydrogenase-like flavoprotein